MQPPFQSSLPDAHSMPLGGNVTRKGSDDHVTYTSYKRSKSTPFPSAPQRDVRTSSSSHESTPKPRHLNHVSTSHATCAEDNAHINIPNVSKHASGSESASPFEENASVDSSTTIPACSASRQTSEPALNDINATYFQDCQVTGDDLANPEAYSKISGPSKLAWTHDGSKKVLAIILSQDHLNRMMRAGLEGRGFREIAYETANTLDVLRFQQRQAQAICDTNEAKMRQIVASANKTPIYDALDCRVIGGLAQAHAAHERNKALVAQIAAAEKEIEDAKEEFHWWLGGVNYLFDDMLVQQGLAEDIPYMRGIDEVGLTQPWANDDPEELAAVNTANRPTAISSQERPSSNTPPVEQQPVKPGFTNSGMNLPSFCTNCGTPITDPKIYDALHYFPCLQSAKMMGMLSAFHPFTGRRIKFHEDRHVPAVQDPDQEKADTAADGTPEPNKDLLREKMKMKEAALRDAEARHQRYRTVQGKNMMREIFGKVTDLTPESPEWDARFSELYLEKMSEFAQKLATAEQEYREVIRECRDAGFHDIIPGNESNAQDFGYDVGEFNGRYANKAPRAFVDRWQNGFEPATALGAFEFQGAPTEVDNVYDSGADALNADFGEPKAPASSHNKSREDTADSIPSAMDHTALASTPSKVNGKVAMEPPTHVQLPPHSDTRPSEKLDSHRFRDSSPVAPVDRVTGKRCRDTEENQDDNDAVDKDDAPERPLTKRRREEAPQITSIGMSRRGRPRVRSSQKVTIQNKLSPKGGSRTEHPNSLIALDQVDVQDSVSIVAEGHYSQRQLIDNWALQMRDGYL